MKKIAIICLLLVLAFSGNSAAFALDGGAIGLSAGNTAKPPAGDSGGSVFEKGDIRVYKSQFTGKYVCEEKPSYFFEVFDEYATLSAELEEEYGYTGETYYNVMRIDHVKGMLWLSFEYYYDDIIGHSAFYFYSADMVRPESFVLKDGYVPPWERLVFNKVHDESEPPLDELLTIDMDAVRFAVDHAMEGHGDASDREGLVLDVVGIPASDIFPNMGDQVYMLEIEKIVGKENLRIGRDPQDASTVAFQYQGYTFWYYLVYVRDGSYDLFPNVVVFVEPAG